MLSDKTDVAPSSAAHIDESIFKKRGQTSNESTNRLRKRKKCSPEAPLGATQHHEQQSQAKSRGKQKRQSLGLRKIGQQENQVVDEDSEMEKARSADARSTRSRLTRPQKQQNRTRSEKKRTSWRPAVHVGGKRLVAVQKNPERMVQKNPERMVGINWDGRGQRWRVRNERRTFTSFYCSRWLEAGMTTQEAGKQAMLEAIAFRESLVKQGAVVPYRESGVKNIQWWSRSNGWQVIWHDEKKKRHSRCFSVKGYLKQGMSFAEAKETALWNAVAARAKMLQANANKKRMPSHR